jgi:hypothetical protein
VNLDNTGMPQTNEPQIRVAVFNINQGATVPDGGGTAFILGSALVGLAAVRRKLVG